jgi:crotonobetainyl-CoA:carnitine CoA-transferase CaiB-like acyl-CoA transferase
MPVTKSSAPLAGFRVLDLSRVLAGPLASQMLGDLGADVIKIERPNGGDDSRRMGTAALAGAPRGRESSMFIAANRNKRSLTLDFAHPKGKAIALALARKSDVLIENYKVGTLARYGLDYASLRAENPRLIYCSVTGYGQSGPKSALPGYDPVFQAESGMMSVTGWPDSAPGGGPLKVGANVSDVIGSYWAGQAILAALLARERGGEGQHIDIALLDCSIAAMSNLTQDYLMSGSVPGRNGNGGPRGGPAGVVPCSDGSIFMACATDDQFRRLVRVLELPGLADDPRYANPDLRWQNHAELLKTITAVTPRWTCAKLLEALARDNLPAGSLYDVAQSMADPQAQHRGLAVGMPHPLSPSLRGVASPIRLSATPVEYRRHPPMLGEHSDEILGELGCDAAGIESLRREGVV